MKINYSKNFVKRFLSFILIFSFLFSSFSVLAVTPDEEKSALDEELRLLEEKISQYDQDLTRTQKEKNTLQNQISTLKTKIAKLNLQISQSKAVIKDLTFQIGDTEDSIGQTSIKIEDLNEQLAGILRLIYEEDQKSLIEVVLSEQNISDFFDNLASLETLNQKSQDLLQEIKGLKVSLEEQKGSLDDEKVTLEKVVKVQTLQKQESEQNKKEQDYFLKLTEVEYQDYLKKKEEAVKRANEIRSRIFEMLDVPQAPTFGEAYDIAKYAASLTGVRPAFLLAILTQESNIGKNVGQCFLKDKTTGAGVIISSDKAVSRVMKPMGLSGRKGDVDDFLKITAELGRDPYNTPVSCPMSYGYGGAMGPAQFIPSTWMEYRDKLKVATGRPADPWNIRDAFLAAAFFLVDYGADKKTATSEWKAAMIYFSGSTNLVYRFYGDNVLNIAKKYQIDIEAMENSN